MPPPQATSALPRLAARLFTDWLNGHHGRTFTLDSAADTAVADAVAREGEERIAIVVRELYEDAAGSPWRVRRDEVERRLRDAAPEGAFLLWVPPGANLPGEEPLVSAFALAIADAAAKLGPGERGAAEFPVTLRLKKLEDEGGHINILGGMSALWARFTGHVSGTYRLDSLAIHRLPEDPAYLQALLETIVASALETPFVGETAEIAAIDAWTLQRLPAHEPAGFAVVAVPPVDDIASGNTGAMVRRSLRRVLKESQVRMSGATVGQGYRALVVAGAYTNEASENISIALRGFDPMIYAAVDFIVALVDGTVKPIYQSPRVRL